MTTHRRTSLSHPLCIDYLEVGALQAKLGMTLCPGKHQPGGASGWWERDLGSDLDQIAAFGAVALVTLMEAPELNDMKVPVPVLSRAVSDRGIEWHHLPIRDADIPDASFEEQWQTAGVALVDHLESGRSIVIHCKGGLGRTGLVAARLLVELGREPADAIRDVRRARQGAIETTAQESYVRNLSKSTSRRLN